MNDTLMVTGYVVMAACGHQYHPLAQAVSLSKLPLPHDPISVSS